MAQAKVLRPLNFKLLLHHSVNLKLCEFLSGFLGICKDLPLVLLTDLQKVVAEPECLSFLELFIFFPIIEKLFDTLFVIVVQLHSEADRNMFAQAFLGTNAGLNALNGAPLATCGTLSHQFQELILVEHSYDRILLRLNISNAAISHTTSFVTLGTNRALIVACIDCRGFMIVVKADYSQVLVTCSLLLLSSSFADRDN